MIHTVSGEHDQCFLVGKVFTVNGCKKLCYLLLKQNFCCLSMLIGAVFLSELV